MTELLQWGQLFKEWAGFVGAIGGPAVAMWAWRSVLKPAYQRQQARAARLEQSLDKIDKLDIAFTRNGGRSAIDRLDQIADSVAVINLRTQMHSDLLTQLILEFCEEGENVLASERVTQTFGFKPGELLRNGWKNLMHEDDRARMTREWQHCVKDRRAYDCAGRFVSKTGDTFHVRMLCQPAYDAGELVRWFGEIRIIEKLPAPGVTT